MRSCSENNFRDFFQNNADFLFILDMEGNIIETNNAVRGILGYPDEDLIGKNVSQIHPAQYREEVVEIVKQILNDKKSFCQIPLQNNNKECIPVETSVIRGVWNSKPALIWISRNMTELKFSEEKFYGVFNQSHVLMVISRIDTGHIVNVNQEFLNTFGYSRDEVIGSTFEDLELFNEERIKQDVFNSFAKEGKLRNFNAIIKAKSGVLLSCLFSLDKLKIRTHEYILTSITDITAQKEAESKIGFLFRQQKLLADVSQLLNTTTNLECVLDEVLNILGVYTNVSRINIYENLQNKTIGMVTHEWCNVGIAPLIVDFQERVYEEIPSCDKLLLDEGLIYSNNVEDLPEDLYQKLKPLNIKTILVYPLYEQNFFYGSIGFYDCVSAQTWSVEELNLLRTVSNIISNALDRKQVLTKLENSEMKLKLAIDSAQECLWEMDIETGKTFFSSGILYKKLGYDPDEMEHTFSGWQKLVHPEDLPAILELVNKHFRGETDLYEATYRLKKKDGEWLWGLDHGMVVERDADKKPLRAIGTIIDITMQKETELQLKKALDTQYKLFSIIAHDLRGPIGNNLPVVEILTDCKELEEDSRNILLKELKKSAKNTYDLLDNLLSWSRSQTNSLSLEPVSFDLNKVIKKNFDLLAYCAKQKEISLSVRMQDDIFAYADVNTISSVIRNLISNAIKFTSNGGAISVSAFDNGSFIEVEITDSGVGMEKEVADTLFSSIQFNSTYGTNKEKGSGLGLALCKDFVERNGGQIRVESILGNGSRFSFTIPRIKTFKTQAAKNLSKKVR